MSQDNNNRPNKLFVIVRKDLEIGAKAAQAVHAVSRFLLENRDQTWNNETIVIIEDEDIVYWRDRSYAMGLDYSYFEEPDLDNLMTAIAIHTERHSLFKHLKLIGAQ